MNCSSAGIRLYLKVFFRLQFCMIEKKNMRYLLLTLAAIFYSVVCLAFQKDTSIYYTLHDSIKAVSFFVEANVKAINTRKEVFAGIKAGEVSLSLEADRKKRELVFSFPKESKVLATGLHIISKEKGEMEWDYGWEVNQSYQLMISIATDSANNFTLYSAYCRLAKENKWKLMGTCRVDGQWSTLSKLATYYSYGKAKAMDVAFNKVWVQRRSGAWKSLLPEDSVAPVINLLSHVDSIQQLQNEIKMIEEQMANGKTDVTGNKDGVYYKILKEGAGRTVSVNDTVTVHYKGYLFSDGSEFDATKEKSAVFPLNRLIKGWQLGLPLCKVGGKIKLVIPSALAYSIRTRAARIPPNSILVFELEVLDAKSPD